MGKTTEKGCPREGKTHGRTDGRGFFRNLSLANKNRLSFKRAVTAALPAVCIILMTTTTLMKGHFVRQHMISQGGRHKRDIRSYPPRLYTAQYPALAQRKQPAGGLICM